MLQKLAPDRYNSRFRPGDRGLRRTPATGGRDGTSSSVNKQAPFESIEELAYVTGAYTRPIVRRRRELERRAGPERRRQQQEPAHGQFRRKTRSRPPSIMSRLQPANRTAKRRQNGSPQHRRARPNTDPLRQLLDDKLGTGKGAPIVAMLTPGTPLNSALDLYIQAKGDNFSVADFGKVAYELTSVDPTTNPYLVWLGQCEHGQRPRCWRVFPGWRTYATQIVAGGARNHVQSDTHYAWVVDELGTGAATALSAAGRF